MGLSLGKQVASARALGPLGAWVCRAAQSTGRGDSQSQDEFSRLREGLERQAPREGLWGEMGAGVDPAWGPRRRVAGRLGLLFLLEGGCRPQEGPEGELWRSPLASRSTAGLGHVGLTQPQRC